MTTLKALCREVSKENVVKGHLRVTGVLSEMPEQTALCIFRVEQEALSNAVKHSEARDVHVHVSASRGRLVLRVKDQGRGFDPLTSETKGIGLLTMRERVELGGGRLTSNAAVTRGTTIEATLPLDHRSMLPLEREMAAESSQGRR